MATGQSGIPGLILRGRVGNAVFQRVGDALQVRERVIPHDPRTPLQIDARERMDRVAARWTALDDEAFRAWTAFGRAQGGAQGWNAYLGLTSKWMLANAGGPGEADGPPRLPPTGPFLGDNVAVAFSPSFACESGGRGEGGEAWEEDGSPSPTPSSPGTSPPRKDGASARLSLVASQPNAEGVLTEIVAQPLTNARRKARARDWRTAGFVRFEAGALETEVTLARGAWAVGFRFVRASSGQATARVEIGAATLG